MFVEGSPRVEFAEARRARAARVGFPPLRECLLAVAAQYEVDAYLMRRSRERIIESRHLIEDADILLRVSNKPSTG